MRASRLPRRRHRRSREDVLAARQRAAVAALIEGCESRSIPDLARLMRRDVALTIDTGGLVPVPVRTAHGDVAVAGALVRLLEGIADATLAPHDVNGAPGVVIRVGERVVGVACLGLRRSAIDELWIVVNPDKLSRWNRRPIAADPSQMS